MNKASFLDRQPMDNPAVLLRLPAWVSEYLQETEEDCSTVQNRMMLAIKLSAMNVSRQTGGPFGAAIFDVDTSELICVGVNLVTSAGTSIAHAEIVAIALAQKILGNYDLGAPGMPHCELVSSTEPCAMCQGAVPWSGIRRLVCGARGEDAMAIGMDEGIKAPNWADALAERGIDVERDVLRSEAAAVLQDYVAQGGPIYNGRQGGIT